MLTSSRGCHSRRLSTNAAVLAASPLWTIEAIYLVRACGLLTPSTSVPGIGLGGLVLPPDSAVLGGLPITSTDFRDFRAHRPRMGIADFSAPAGRFVARVSAFVGTGDDRLSSAPFWPAAEAIFTSGLAVPSGATRQNHSRGTIGGFSVALPPTGRISTRTRRRTAVAAGAAQPAVDYGSGPCRVPRMPSSRADSPPRVPRARLPLAAAPSISRVPTTVLTVPIPYDRDRAEPLGAPPLGLSIPSAFPSTPMGD